MTANPAVTGKISAAKTGLILLFLLAVWVGLNVQSSRKEVPHKFHGEEHHAETKLHAVGLPDNPDLDALPEIFAIWQGKAEWKNGKAKFAYWHPGTKTYAYFFEASRVGGRIRFAAIPEPQEPEYAQDESLGDDCPIRFYRGLDLETIRPQIIVSDPDPVALKPNLEIPVVQVPKPDSPLLNPQPKH